MEASPQLDTWRNTELAEEFLREGYSDRLFFHVYEHALNTRDVARELGKWVVYEEKKKPPGDRREVDFYVLDWAALGHDYGYLEYSVLPADVKSRYPTREKYAAAMVGGHMAMMGAPQDTIAKVKEAIWSTEAGVGCTSLEGRILRQADLANVTSKNRAVFFGNTVTLYREYRFINGENPNLFFPRGFLSYVVTSHRLLSIYNAEDVSLGDFDRLPNGMSRFCQSASENIRMLLPDRIKKLAELAGSTLLTDIKDI